MGRTGHGQGHHWASRDYNMSIPCLRTTCPANFGNKCAMPSAIKIDASGHCTEGDELIKTLPKKLPKPIDGD